MELQMNVESTLSSLNLEPSTNVHRAIKAVGDIIDLSRDKLGTANEIIVGLGAPAVTKERTATVLAKGLIEQALVKGKEYKPEEAMAIVAGKYMRLVEDQPAVFSIKNGVKSLANASVKTERASSSNNKKAAALAIFEANQGQSKSEIARKISAEREISMANALYYVCRVFSSK